MSKERDEIALRALGWKDAFARHLPSQYAQLNHQIHRVTQVQRTGLVVAPPLGSGGVEVPVSGKWFQRPEQERPTVGDWIIVDSGSGALVDCLPRTSLLARLSPAGNGNLQLIAANVDTALVVTSCNADFSIARLERYVSVVLEAGIEPVVVLTKTDLVQQPNIYTQPLIDAFPKTQWLALNALEATAAEALEPWCGEGQTIALLGSSGVGKSTLVNTLMGAQTQRTQAIREEDGKGRHTTTARSAHLLPQGGVILDSPGMREFQMTEASAGVAELFADIERLAQACRFRDCAHNAEPGCAVQAAIAAGQLDQRRLDSYNKLKG